MHINHPPHPRPLSTIHHTIPPPPPPPHHYNRNRDRRAPLVEMSGCEFNSLSGAGGVSGSVGTGCGEWDIGLEGGFHDAGGAVGFSNHTPFLPAAYTPFNTENGVSNAGPVAGRGFQTQALRGQFGTQMLSYGSMGKFANRSAQPPSLPPSLSSAPVAASVASGFQISQGNEYWTSLANMGGEQGGDWKMEFNNNSSSNNNNNVLMDFGGKCGYSDFNTLPMQTGRLGSFPLCSASDTQSPDALHFSPNDEGDEYAEKRWGDPLIQSGEIISHHGLPYTFFDDSNTTTLPPSATFPAWNDAGLDTVSPKALTLSSSSVSFSGSSSSECGSLDSVSTQDGNFQSAGGEHDGLFVEGKEGVRQEVGEVKERRKLPERPVRQYVAIAPGVERDRWVGVVSREAETSLSPATTTTTTPQLRNPPTHRNSTSTPHSQTRSTKDAFLIASKQAGMSYRAIRQAGNFSEAESTLRGRYRTLTKQKEDRVRKPEWTEGDVRLLREGVERFRCGKKGGRARGGKTPWKRVAEYIEGNGGSYRFGNATCRKMWDRLGEEEEG